VALKEIIDEMREGDIASCAVLMKIHLDNWDAGSSHTEL
jgi:hypothetical protein